jgi:hypothetical protein
MRSRLMPMVLKVGNEERGLRLLAGEYRVDSDVAARGRSVFPINGGESHLIEPPGTPSDVGDAGRSAPRAR